jgi:predicted component of type VI protein secretion system
VAAAGFSVHDGAVQLVLEVVEGPVAGTRIPLDDPVELGRDPDLEFHLDDREISRRHARVEADGDGAVISDLGSTNGTYVNDQPITTARRLVSGDQVRMGLSVLELRGAVASVADRTVQRPVPQVTKVGQGLLRPVAPQELPDRTPAAGVAAFAAEELEPAFVPAGIVDDVARPTARGPLARLVDVQVKHRASVAAALLLSASALSVIAYYAAS